MFPCRACHRHVRESERVCPFCGATLFTTSNTGALASHLGAFTLAAMSMFTSGCGPDKVDTTAAEASTSTSTSTTTDESSDSTDSTGIDTDASTSVTTITSGSFYALPGDVGETNECDPFMQDCPEGEKCVPYASTGGTWNDNKCVPITGDGQVGDACLSGGRVEATDDCAADSICWDVVGDGNGGWVGTCTAFCQGTPDTPMCAVGTECLISNQGSVTLCIETCDPLMQACADGHACFWADTDFFCLATTQDLGEGQPCSFFNDCAAGLYCAPASSLADCQETNCCTAFCALDDMNACPDPALECVAFFGQGMAPVGYENLGACVVP